MFQRREKVDFHKHPMNFTFGAFLPDFWRKKWVGMFTPTGWLGKGKKKFRYFACGTCKDLVCEKWLLNPSQFIINDTTVHEHGLSLWLIETDITWVWSIIGKKWEKDSYYSKKEHRVSFRWDIWDFDTWPSWYYNFHEITSAREETT